MQEKDKLIEKFLARTISGEERKILKKWVLRKQENLVFLRKRFENGHKIRSTIILMKTRHSTVFCRPSKSMKIEKTGFPDCFVMREFLLDYFPLDTGPIIL